MVAFAENSGLDRGRNPRAGGPTFVGIQVPDAITGLYYLRNRTHKAVFGRWIQWEPIEYKGGINLYEYVGDWTAWRQPPFIRWRSNECAVLGEIGAGPKCVPDKRFSLSSVPSGEICHNTVTLAGLCVHRGALGHLVYGFIANYFRMPIAGNRAAVGPESDCGSTGRLLSVFLKANRWELAVAGTNAPKRCQPLAKAVNAGANQVKLPPLNPHLDTQAFNWHPLRRVA